MLHAKVYFYTLFMQISLNGKGEVLDLDPPFSSPKAIFSAIQQ